MAGALVALFLAACGGSSNGPTPVQQQPPSGPPSTGPSVNVAPVVEGITVGADRAEVDTDVTLTAAVKDDETPVDQMTFEWEADAGTFSGEGASVKWRAPKDIRTPADFTITLRVTEAYGAPDSSGARAQNVTTATAPPFRVHDSPKELGDMSLRFLSDFADSSIPASVCVRDFTDSCRGKADERNDIEANRTHFDILSSSLALRSVNINASGLTANVTVSCTFNSKIKVCDPGDKSCVVGDTGTARGDCLLTGKYEDRRWWLCDSHFVGRLASSMIRFFGKP